MKLNNIQNWTKEAWSKSNKTVDEKQELLFLLEEIGEMAEAVRKINGKKENKKIKVDLEKEMGDILLSIISLANRYKINLEKAFLKTMKSIGLPINLTSFGLYGKSGRYGASCSENCPDKTARDFLMASSLIFGNTSWNCFEISSFARLIPSLYPI